MISLVIPTINRPDFIKKYLQFLKLQGFQGEVLIGDSSSLDLFNETSNFIKKNSFCFRVRHASYPDRMHFEVIQELIEFIQYEFCMYICDDDFLLNSTLLKCVEFLNENPDYTSAGGRALMLDVDDSWKILSIRDYSLSSLEESSPINRLRILANNYEVVAYSLSRTADFIKRWPKSDDFFEKGIVVETHPCFSAAAQGKIKILEDLFVIRTNHERRILLPNFEETIAGEYWESSVNYSINELTSIMKEQERDKVPEEDIRDECSNIWQEHIEMKRLGFSQKRVTTSNFRNFMKNLRSFVIQTIRIFFENFRKKEIHHFLTKDNELEAYNSFVEVLSLSYNPEKIGK